MTEDASVRFLAALAAYRRFCWRHFRRSRTKSRFPGRLRLRPGGPSPQVAATRLRGKRSHEAITWRPDRSWLRLQPWSASRSNSIRTKLQDGRCPRLCRLRSTMQTLPNSAALPAQMNAELFLEWVDRHAVRLRFNALHLSQRTQPNGNLAGHSRATNFANIGLASLDVTSVHADWSGIEQHSDEIGRAAVDLLFQSCKLENVASHGSLEPSKFTDTGTMAELCADRGKFKLISASDRVSRLRSRGPSEMDHVSAGSGPIARDPRQADGRERSVQPAEAFPGGPPSC